VKANLSIDDLDEETVDGPTAGRDLLEYSGAFLLLCFAKILCAPKIARFPIATACPILGYPFTPSAKILPGELRAVDLYICGVPSI
jgi:hypothetical protein